MTREAPEVMEELREKIDHKLSNDNTGIHIFATEEKLKDSG